MKNTSLKLHKELPEIFVEAFRAISNTTAEFKIDYFLIGATARDIILEYVYAVGIQRATNDIDFGVALASWEEFRELKKRLVNKYHFRADKKLEHRLYYGLQPNDIRVDLVPFGAIESSPGIIEFPESGFAMNIAGFEESQKACLSLEISEGLEIPVASLPSIVVLKFMAYNDRPQERRDDLKDIWFIVQKYLDAGNEKRLYEEEHLDILDEEEFDIRTAGARLLGRDIAVLLNAGTREIILKHLSEDSEDSGLSRVAQLLHSLSGRFAGDENNILMVLKQLRRGILENA